MVSSFETGFGKKVDISQTPAKEDVIGIMECCKKTIRIHANNNPMMVCPECKQIIKCFEDERGYFNYLRFCSSRHRKVVTDVYDEWKVVVFRSYDTFSS